MSKYTSTTNLKRDIRRLRATADQLDGIIALTGIPAALREIATNFAERFEMEEVHFAQSRRDAETRNRFKEETKGITPSNLRWVQSIIADIDINDLL